MGVQKITFDGAEVSAKVDADLHHFLFSAENGILKGMKSEIGFTLANNTITFTDGYVVVYGRLIYVENNTTIQVTPNASRLGFVVLGVDTLANEVRIYLKEQAGSYPVLTQHNLLENNGLYELALCAYQKTTTSVSLTHYARQMIEPTNTKLANAKQELRQELSYQRKNLTMVSNGVYRFNVGGSYDIDTALIVVIINISTVAIIPGAMLFVNTGSNTFVNYAYGSQSFSLLLSYENNTVTLSLGSTLHTITALFLYR